MLAAKGGKKGFPLSLSLSKHAPLQNDMRLMWPAAGGAKKGGVGCGHLHAREVDRRQFHVKLQYRTTTTEREDIFYVQLLSRGGDRQ